MKLTIDIFPVMNARLEKQLQMLDRPFACLALLELMKRINNASTVLMVSFPLHQANSNALFVMHKSITTKPHAQTPQSYLAIENSSHGLFLHH